MSYFRTGGPDKEHRTNLSPPTRRAQERSKGDATCPTTSQSPPQWHPFWLSNACTTRKFPESGWLANDNLEINPNTINPSLRGTGQSCAWLPLSCCSLPRHPFPTKSLAVSAHVSPETIHVWVLDKSPFSGPGRGFLFLQQYHFVIRWEKKSLPQICQDGLLLSLGLMWLPGEWIDYEEEFSDQFSWEGTTLSTSLTMPCWGKSQCPGALI